MGADYYGHVFIGIPLMDAVQIDEEIHVATKYHPDTGKPYDKRTVTKRLRVGTTVLEENFVGDARDRMTSHLSKIERERKIDKNRRDEPCLEVFRVTDGEDEDTFIGLRLGEETGSNGGDNETELGNFNQVTVAFKKTTELFLKDLGVIVPLGDLELRHILYCSY